MRMPRLLLVLPLTLGLTGCLSSYTLVKVKANGSGTVEQTTLVSPQMLGMMTGMMQGMAGGQNGGKPVKAPTVADMFKEEDLRAAAARMGTGVRFVSSTPAKADGREGVTAVYAFDDITKLSVNQAMTPPGGKSASITPKDESPIMFGLTGGMLGAKTLSITMPEGKPKAGAKPEKPEGTPDLKDMPPEMLAMMKTMFQGAKIGIDIEVDGKLIKTNSPYVTGSRITLMEVDLAALLEDPAKLQKMQEFGPNAGFDQVRAALGDIKGVKMPTERITTIDFVGR
jgi:hypothetical protein